MGNKVPETNTKAYTNFRVWLKKRGYLRKNTHTKRIEPELLSQWYLEYRGFRKEESINKQIIGIFKLIGVMMDNPSSMESLEFIMEAPRDTIEIEMKRLESLGFVIDQDFKDRFFINMDLLPDFVKALNVNQTV